MYLLLLSFKILSLPCKFNLLRTSYIFIFYQCCIVCASERKYILGIRRFINNILVVYHVCDVNVLYGVEWYVVVWCVVCVCVGVHVCACELYIYTYIIYIYIYIYARDLDRSKTQHNCLGLLLTNWSLLYCKRK